MKLPTIIGSAQRVISRLILAMGNVLQEKHGLVKEKLLRFGRDNVMLLRAFPGIALIPVEARYLREVNHARILSSYTSTTSRDNRLFTLAPEQER